MNFEQYVCFKCPNCADDEGHLVDKEWIDDEGYNTCYKCDAKFEVISIEQITNPNLFLELTDSQLESENYHDRIGLADSIWSTIEKYIPEDKKIEVVKEVCKEIANT